MCLVYWCSKKIHVYFAFAKSIFYAIENSKSFRICIQKHIHNITRVSCKGMLALIYGYDHTISGFTFLSLFFK